MKAILCNRGHPEYGVATIPFPIPDEEYTHCMELLHTLKIGGVTEHDCYVERKLMVFPSQCGLCTYPNLFLPRKHSICQAER